MKFRRLILLVILVGVKSWMLSAAFAQQDEDQSAREEWQAQVDRARQRVEQIRREGKFVVQENQPGQESAKELARRALDDEDLRKGDVVSTESGFLRFEGILPDNRRVFSPVDPGLGLGK